MGYTPAETTFELREPFCSCGIFLPHGVALGARGPILFGRNELVPFQSSTFVGRSLDNPLPVPRRNIAAVAPLPNSDPAFTNVCGQRLGVSGPDGIDLIEVFHA